MTDAGKKANGGRWEKRMADAEKKRMTDAEKKRMTDAGEKSHSQWAEKNAVDYDFFAGVRCNFALGKKDVDDCDFSALGVSSSSFIKMTVIFSGLTLRVIVMKQKVRK